MNAKELKAVIKIIVQQEEESVNSCKEQAPSSGAYQYAFKVGWYERTFERIFERLNEISK